MTLVHAVAYSYLNKHVKIQTSSEGILMNPKRLITRTIHNSEFWSWDIIHGHFLFTKASVTC